MELFSVYLPTVGTTYFSRSEIREATRSIVTTKLYRRKYLTSNSGFYGKESCARGVITTFYNSINFSLSFSSHGKAGFDTVIIANLIYPVFTEQLYLRRETQFQY